MAKTSYSLSHTKWMCKYHIVFTPKYRRKAIYYKVRSDLIDIVKHLCRCHGVEIIKGYMMPDYVHLNLKYKYRNRKFWARGYYVSTVGLNEKTVAKYIREQEKNDISLDKLSVKEYEDPFSDGEFRTR